ncbi:hypothetical protein SAMN02745962_05184 [Pseudomonas sp. LAIL14HWK12:I11]|nr:hypothetical protein SAMN02745962_05184 [Pseudomonas sp. LAIL14HWK12:I11]SMR80255.1 hypothetical protein SAMN05661028_05104 [Pseudomonas sp. LAIL14HWK12:I10]SOD08156.1 hypothetical protein SAMN05660296_05322 [Pseudomonas sp. LAIL14HWK12:I8]
MIITAEMVDTNVKTVMTSGITNNSVNAIAMHTPENTSALTGVPDPDSRPNAVGACCWWDRP